MDGLIPINDTTLSVFINRGRYGVKNKCGKIVAIKTGRTAHLKKYYKYDIYKNSYTGDVWLLVITNIHNNFDGYHSYYLPLERTRYA